MASEIYQTLWDLDLENNGCTVSLKNKEGNWINPNADILIDPQDRARGSTDQAPDNLFFKVNENKLEANTYQTCIKLFDNYVAKREEPEDMLNFNTIEDGEIEDFLKTILDTEVMKAALSYINSLGNNLDENSLTDELKRLWFEIYTNFFGGNALSFCSGFEHIFVGEEGSRNSIGGYHNWIKFYLDEKNERVDFRGFNFGGSIVPSIPYVITLSMSWEPKGIRGNSLGILEKDKGGFFVGPSPELDIALATVAYFESVAGLFSGSELENVEIQGGLFDLVLYRNIEPNGQRGDKLRSFFPKFIKPVNPVDDVIVVDSPNNKGIIKITKALVNVEGAEEEGKEWVEISNTSKEIIDLTGWTISDRNNRKEQIDGTILPNKTRRIFLSEARLSNKGGMITLTNEQNEIVGKVSYNKAAEGEVFIFN